MKVLCIIDMQYWFHAARSHKTTKAICYEIRMAKEHGLPIVIVEYLG